MQNFVANFCQGIEFTTKSFTKIQKEEMANMYKDVVNKNSRIGFLEKQIADLKEELRTRPFQSNFSNKELQDQIKHFMELAQMGADAENIAKTVQYSGADNALDAVTRTSAIVERMQIAKRTRVTLEDKSLVKDHNKEQAMEDMTDVVKNEGKRVMNSISMKVLNNFWRHFTTADAET